MSAAPDTPAGASREGRELASGELPMEFAPANSTATPDELKERIETAIPGSTASVTGDGHHFSAVVTAPVFQGMSRIAQHRLVHDVFGAELGGRIHALSIQTRAE